MPCSDKPIHILGLGNLGRLFGHALATSSNPPPLTLLFHRPSQLREWSSAGQKISITSSDGSDTSTSSNYSVELIGDTSNKQPIESLIIATKTLNTVNALSPIKHRLGANSTILFTQNGMRTMEEVSTTLFPDPQTRPQYLAAITSHGVYSTTPFCSVHAGLANVTISRVTAQHPDFKDTAVREGKEIQSQSQYLIDRIVAAPILNAKAVEPEELVLLQLEKLVANAMMNPLTVIFNCKNGELFNREPILNLMRKLLAEVSQVILALPELRDNAEVPKRFGKEALEDVALGVAEKTAKNTSSMLQDAKAGRKTEIDYINGYVVRRGKELGVDVTNNEKLVEMVKEGNVIGEGDIEKYFPGS